MAKRSGKSRVVAHSPKKPKYGAAQIQALEGLEAVRKRPGMYIGGTGLDALHHLIYEVVDNSIDEAMAGHATTITVRLDTDGSCTVQDDGRGIPVDPMKHENPAINGKSAVEVVLTKLHAGGKFQQEGSAYKVSGGLHGVGVSCVNALSVLFSCEVYRDGKAWAIDFSRGEVTEPLRSIPMPKPDSRGTRVRFLPDPTIFPDTQFNPETVENRLRDLAFLNPGIRLRLVHGEEIQKFYAKVGLPEYVTLLHGDRPALSDVIYLRSERAKESLVCEVAMQYGDGYNENVLSFANNIRNKDGGTHATGFKNAISRVLNAYAKREGIIKEKDPVPSGEDWREGLTAVVSVKLPNPTFNNQPKERLLNPEIEEFVSKGFAEKFSAWLEENPAEAKKLCLKGIVAAQAREAARKARELTRRKSAFSSGAMPHKLRDCKTKDIERSELFIVEGDSAGGSATQGRDVETQAILPLKGKVLNVEKARLDKVLAFEEISTLISALRVGIGVEADAKRVRYGKIVIMTDADVDGSHIRTLLLTFFFRQMPDLIRHGRIYIAQPPLYQLADKSGVEYVRDGRIMEDRVYGKALSRVQLVVRRGYLRNKGEYRHEHYLSRKESREAVGVMRQLMAANETITRRGSTMDKTVYGDLPESERVRALFEKVHTYGIRPGHFDAKQEYSDSGDPIPGAFGWFATDDSPLLGTAANIPEALHALSLIGRQGLEVKRFKGLGEMDAGQLWETTMDPSKRTLLRVTWDVASEAESLFSVLMGDQVEPRRRFIEEHALEVKHVDV